MDKLESKVKKILSSWSERVVPEGLADSQIKILAKNANLNFETLKTLRKRKTAKAETIVRGLLASGVSEKALINLPLDNASVFPKNQAKWHKLGQKLSEEELGQYLTLISQIREILKSR